MTQPTFKLSDFEGPLELMLHLLSKHKLNIEDIEISILLEQYIEFIENRTDVNLEVDSEFIEMAARLVHIKTIMLLPKHEEEAKELKDRLTQELMEYQACKLAAENLRELGAANIVFVRKPMELLSDKTYTNTHPLSMLLMQIGLSDSVKKRKASPSVSRFTNIVSVRVISVSSRIINILKKLYRGGSISFMQAFEDAPSRGHIVATFMGILELIKAGRVVTDEENTKINLVKKTNKDRNGR